MAHVFDIARHILQRQGRTSTLKLQKLVYYTQVWSVATSGSAIFGDSIKAWAQGPVVPTLYHQHKGRKYILVGDVQAHGPGLSDAERAHVDGVLRDYGGLPAAYLSALTHFEQPWREARNKGKRDGYKSPTIELPAIRAFYANRTPTELVADYQMHIAATIMDEHKESLARLAL